MGKPVTTPQGRQDEGRDQMIEFLRSRIGKEVWLGICAPDEPRVHGHRMWFVVALQPKGDRFYVVLRVDSWKPVVTVNTDLIVRGGPDPPPPDDCHFLDEWDEGLSKPPSVQDVIGMARSAADA